MRGKPDNKIMQRITGAAFLCAALVLLVLFLRPLTDVVVSSALSTPSAAPAPSPSAPQTTCTVAFFGSASDPFCAALSPALDDLAAANGWRLIRYDCRGNATNQKGQMEDFVRTENADIAVIYSVLSQEELDAQVEDIHGVCPVITVGSSVGADAKRYVSAHVGADETERIRMLTAYFGADLQENSGVLLLYDVPDAATEALYNKVLSEEKVTVLGKNYSWLGAAYAERYLNTGVEDFSNVGGVFCTSRHGTAGTAKALGEMELRDGIKIAAFFYEPAMAEDMARGELDAAVAVSPTEAAEMLADILPKRLNGEPIVKEYLTPILLTPENIGTVDLGY